MSAARLLAASVLAAVLALSGPASASAATPAPRVGAHEAILVDAATGAVIWRRAGHRPALVASTTKILTALVAESGYKQGQRFRVPGAAETVDGTRFGFRAGTVLTREQLLVTLLMVSANDAAETLATAWPQGGRQGFIAAMQARCAELGCTDSTWRDPSGLDAPGHEASAADLARLGRALLERPFLARVVAASMYRFRWPGGRVQILNNHNKLVRYDDDPGALGIKTGYTTKAKSTIVAAERRGGRTLIAVVLGADDIYGDARALFDYGFKAPVPSGGEVLAPPAEVADLPFSGAALPDAPLPPTGTRTAMERLGVPLTLAGAAALGALLVGLLLVVAYRHDRHAG